MKRMLFLTALLMLLSVRSAHGQPGINLSWNDCGANGSPLRTFACNSNSGQHTLVASFASGLDLSQLVGIEGVIDLCSMTFVLPAWWQMFDAGTCRPSALSSSFDFTSGWSSCADYWQGQAMGGMDYTMGAAWGFNGARIRVVAAIPSNAVSPVDGSTEYYAYRVTIRNDASTGTGACAGCGESVCIIFNSLKLVQPLGAGDYILTSPLINNYAMWQGDVIGCPFIVPTQKRSWGQIKSLYR